MTDIKYVKINILNLFDIKSNNKKYPYKNQDWRSKIFEISEIKNKIRNLSSIELSKLK